MIVAVSRFKAGAAEAAWIKKRFRSGPRLVDLHADFAICDVVTAS